MPPDAENQPSSVRYVALALGGPLNGEEVISRFYKGLVAVDKAKGLCWIYDYVDVPWDEHFQVREEDGRQADTYRRWQAADGFDYDVIAVVS